MKTKTTIGTTDSFKELFEKQMQNQMLMLLNRMYEVKESLCILPKDDISLASYHVLQLISEIGEVLDADKRWKNFRNDKYEEKSKADEIADCFIVLMNVAMFSGIGPEMLYKAIDEKVNIVYDRINKKLSEGIQ